MDWWFDILIPVWVIVGGVGILWAILCWGADPAPVGTRAREQEIRLGAITFLAALLAPLTIVALVIYGLIWLVRTALGK